ncbi:MAG TPA: hypothetical protein VHD36_21985 [Pirellulales bacterium]|nr:hypothetical protein [Pirellulales bacterium]
MNAPPDDASPRLRWGVYWLLIAIASGGILGRILSVDSLDYIRLEQHLKREGRKDWAKQRPFLSANDRSRWATIRALVEYGTYRIDDVVSQPNWDTIDMVKHDDAGHAAPEPGEGHLYSSKPPLFPTILAGEYWLIVRLTGRTLGTHPFAIGRFMLVTINLLPLVIYFVLWGKLADRLGTTDWGRIFTMACATFGTFLSTFAVVLNNHLPAAVTAVATVYLAVRITVDGERRWWYFAMCGFMAAFTAVNELPALSLFGVTIALVAWHAPRQTLLAFVPPALLVAAASFGTNYLAHHTWAIPYAHREDDNNWYKFKYVKDGKVRDSYWSNREARSPIDQGEESVPRYAFHVLIGHHGIFSLTPIWLLSIVGLGMLCASRDRGWREWGLAITAVSVVCVAFYISRSLDDRNYGGMTAGFRWAFWMAPLWLVAMQPAADWASRRRWSQLAAAALLGLSVLSVSYPTWNPWTQPWLWDALEAYKS